MTHLSGPVEPAVAADPYVGCTAQVVTAPTWRGSGVPALCVLPLLKTVRDVLVRPGRWA
jgi:hypothetical protein